MAEPGFAYVQARLQSRHGGLPGASTWQALEASQTAGQYLALAQAGPLARWVQGLDVAGDPHRIEQRLRAQWQRYVQEVAAWQPADWQTATRWFGSLPELPLAPRASGVISPRASGLLSRSASDVPSQSATDAPAQQPSAAPAPRMTRAQALETPARWLSQWLQLMPRSAALPATMALLQRAATLLMPGLAGDRRGRAAGSEPVRQALLRLFRRHGGTPVAVFAHLAMVALDLERLRGGIVTRLLFAREAVVQGV